MPEQTEQGFEPLETASNTDSSSTNEQPAAPRRRRTGRRVVRGAGAAGATVELKVEEHGPLFKEPPTALLASKPVHALTAAPAAKGTRLRLRPRGRLRPPSRMSPRARRRVRAAVPLPAKPTRQPRRHTARAAVAPPRPQRPRMKALRLLSTRETPRLRRPKSRYAPRAVAAQPPRRSRARPAAQPMRSMRLAMTRRPSPRSMRCASHVATMQRRAP